jgi:hypothetical protein
MIRWGNFEIKFPKVTTKAMIAFIVIFGYVLAIGTLAYLEVQKEQLDILDKALVGLGTLAGAVVNGLFNANKPTDHE